MKFYIHTKEKRS